jgi:23S rRNA (uridine2552-2'-O)-methyltransferase
LLELLGSDHFDVVLSDMAPNTTGIKSVDQDRSFDLVSGLFELLPQVLKPGGNFVVKVFEGEQYQKAQINWKKRFKEVHLLRPKSTRSTSKEIFFIGKGMLNVQS